MTPRRPPLNPRARRAALVGLSLGCAAAAVAIGLAVVGPGEPPALPVPASVAPDDLDFAPQLVGPGTWTVATGVPLPDGLDPARLPPFLRPHPPADNPFPSLPGVPPAAVRVGPDGRANAAFVGPLDPAAAVADWRAVGWDITDRSADPAGRVVRVSRGEVTAVGWVVPSAAGTYVLFTPALTGARR